MSQRDSVSDRIRPFLKAMERSINAARQARLDGQSPGMARGHDRSPAGYGRSFTRDDSDASSETAETALGESDARPLGRLKARPKRPSPGPIFNPRYKA